MLGTTEDFSRMTSSPQPPPPPWKSHEAELLVCSLILFRAVLGFQKH